MDSRQPSLAVDCAVFDTTARLLLIRRRHPPFQGQYALPGGFIEYGETVEQAAARELVEETGLVSTRLTLIGVYSDPKRDPRGHVVSVAYLAAVTHYDAKPGDDAVRAEFVANWRSESLAFDHDRIARDAWAVFSP
ncbi:MAG TPA: NUDIX hydrolase [Xanthobacteraceae bacterium]